MARRPENRSVVLDVLRRARRILPAEVVVRRARAAHPTVGRATIYRSLRSLVQLGVVERYPAGYGIPDHAADHHHVTCGLCGRSAVPALAEAERALSAALARAGFEMVAHDIRIDARCVAHER